MNINFNLARPNATKSIIMLRVSWDGNRVRKNTGLSIDPGFWNADKQLVHKKYQLSMETNTSLNNFRISLENYYFAKKATNQVISKKDIIDEICKIIEPDTTVKMNNAKKSFLQCFQEFIDDRKSDELFSDGTIKNYRTCLNHLKGFNTSRNKIKLEFENINQEFHNAFFNYTAKKGMSNVTFGKNIRIVKTFMYYAKKNKWHNESDFGEYLKDIKAGSPDVYIDDQELELIENYEPDSDKLKTVKDCFLIQLYTGIRYSDLAHLNPTNPRFWHLIV